MSASKEQRTADDLAVPSNPGLQATPVRSGSRPTSGSVSWSRLQTGTMATYRCVVSLLFYVLVMTGSQGEGHGRTHLG